MINNIILKLIIIAIFLVASSCTRRPKIVDLIGLEPIKYTEDSGLRYARVSILYSKQNNQNLFALVCEKAKVEFNASKGFKEGELFSPLEQSRKFYANKAASRIFDTKKIGNPLSLFKIETKNYMTVITVYEFKDYVGMQLASGS